MKKLLLITVAALALSACGKGRSADPVGNAREAAKDKDLQGTFQSKCDLEIPTFKAVLAGSESLGDALKAVQNSVTSERIEYNFDGKNVTRKTFWYAQTDCAGDAVTFQENGTFEILDENRVSDKGGRRINFNFTAAYATVTDAGKPFADAVSLCDAKPWTSNEEKEVTGVAAKANCMSSTLPRAVYNVERVDAGTLYLGVDANKPNTEAERPDANDIMNGVQFQKK